ncbi:hypothetical protein [Actinomadura vinacea]
MGHTARLRGRPAPLTDLRAVQARRMYGERAYSVRQIGGTFGVSRARYL